MDFEPSDEQRLLLESVSRLLADNYGFAQRKTYLARPEGYSTNMWGKFAELGLLGLPFAEQYGGFGGGAQEIMLVMQAFGRVLVLEPFLSTVVLCGTAIQAFGDDAQKQALLPAIAEGALKLAFAHGERQARYDLTDVVTTAQRSGGAWVLDGTTKTASRCFWSTPALRGSRGAVMTRGTKPGRRMFRYRTLPARYSARSAKVSSSSRKSSKQGSPPPPPKPSARWRR
jgi:alkylation response protein AidB-like acyl-CoA dehydrogenase